MSLSNLALPNSHIMKLLKASLEASGSSNIKISADTRDVVNKATCLFILYLTNAALDECNKGKKKRSTLSPTDILTAVHDLDIPLVTKFVEMKAHRLDQIRDEKKHKRDEEKRRRAAFEDNDIEDAANGEESAVSPHKRARTATEEENEDDMVNPFV